MHRSTHSSMDVLLVYYCAHGNSLKQTDHLRCVIAHIESPGTRVCAGWGTHSCLHTSVQYVSGLTCVVKPRIALRKPSELLRSINNRKRSRRLCLYLFLGFLVWVVVAVIGFNGIGFLHLLITMATKTSQNSFNVSIIVVITTSINTDS